jgi:GT2 family glycosyltransferase
MHAVSVVIPSYNRGALLVQTVEQFIHCDGEEYELLVVDQSEEENAGMKRLITGYPEKIRYYRITERGLPLARNYGIAHARYPVLLFCDDDVIPSPGLIVAHARHYDDERTGGIAGRIVTAGQPRMQVRSSRIGRFSRMSGNQIDHFDATMPTEVDHGQGCNLSFRRSLFETIGGFDMRFGGSAFLEETDVCLRVRRAGYRIWFDPVAEVVHLKEPGGGCRPRNPEDWFWWYGHNYMLLFLKHMNWYAWPGFLVFRLATMATGAWRAGNPRVLVHGLRGMAAGFGIVYKH